MQDPIKFLAVWAIVLIALIASVNYVFSAECPAGSTEYSRIEAGIKAEGKAEVLSISREVVSAIKVEVLRRGGPQVGEDTVEMRLVAYPNNQGFILELNADSCVTYIEQVPVAEFLAFLSRLRPDVSK